MPAKLLTYVSIFALAAGVSTLAAFSSGCVDKKGGDEDSSPREDDDADDEDVDETISVTVIEGCPGGDIVPMTQLAGTDASCKFAIIIDLDDDCELDTLTIHGDGRVPSPGTVDVTRGVTFAFDQTVGEPTVDDMTWSWSRTLAAGELNDRVRVAIDLGDDETCAELGTLYVQLTESE